MERPGGLPDKTCENRGKIPLGSQVNYRQYKQDALEMEVVRAKKFLMGSINAHRVRPELPRSVVRDREAENHHFRPENMTISDSTVEYNPCLLTTTLPRLSMSGDS
jgi:hypothetical protein